MSRKTGRVRPSGFFFAKEILELSVEFIPRPRYTFPVFTDT